MKQKVIILQIRESGEDYTAYACKTFEIAHRIIREWFSDYNNEDCIEIPIQQETGRKVPTIKELEDYLWDNDIGYWEITEQVVLCK